ncbi:50S ribosomal protein L20 [Melioribacteraceae bacterium 4301-Me]|uniref:50S ribosomal protein L20 n=1 Tax=Pyranulibacter aquaticus TaxID=3163344 RepID=UPI0035983989
MPRAKNNVASRRRRKKMLRLAKGYWGARKNVWTVAKHHIEKGLLHAYRDRKLKKRTYRQLWIVRINAAARLNGTTYSKLIHAMDEKGVAINRKLLANLAVENPQAFADVVKFVMN